MMTPSAACSRRRLRSAERRRALISWCETPTKCTGRRRRREQRSSSRSRTKITAVVSSRAATRRDIFGTSAATIPGRRRDSGPASFDHIVGHGLQSQGNGEAERLGGLEVDHQLELELGWLLDRKVGWRRALENADDVGAGAAII